jgi:hypothetical protein
MAHFAGLNPNIVNWMLNNIERGAFFIKPTGKNLAPNDPVFPRNDLHKSARPFLRLPRRGFFTGAQTHNQIP